MEVLDRNAVSGYQEVQDQVGIAGNIGCKTLNPAEHQRSSSNRHGIIQEVAGSSRNIRSSEEVQRGKRGFGVLGTSGIIRKWIRSEVHSRIQSGIRDQGGDIRIQSGDIRVRSSGLQTSGDIRVRNIRDQRYRSAGS
jgi:hypothetical protein